MRLNKWLNFLENNQPLPTVFHYDADGVFATSLFSTVYNIQASVAKEFQDYQMRNTIAKVGIDIGQPIQKSFQGVVFDHHEHIKPWYHLIYDNVPAGLIIYNLFKEKIPKEHHWKVVGSLIGDGQPELIPNEVWDNFKHFLLELRAKIYRKYTQPNIYQYVPVYKLLSSPVNAMC